MTAAFYADQYKRFATYCRNYGDNKLYKIAGGPNVDDYNWTETLMKNINPWIMNGLSLHSYTIPKTWENKGSATQFSEEEYFNTIRNTLRMEELVTRHSSIMDRYDPAKRVGLMVDEWGTWYNVEPGTNPGFLFQQNTIRDALVAGINLNIFNNHCDRVKMSNIAQTVNVLQAVIFTDGDKMLLTPTYYVFEMYKVHQDAALIPLSFQSPQFEFQGKKIPAVSASASRDKQGKTHITFTNSNPNQDIEITIDLRGGKFAAVSGMVVTAKSLNAHNTFTAPETVKAVPFTGAKLNKDQLTVKLPSKSVVMVALQ
jgi:alpha-N-arabinofuranosidase